MRHLILFLSLAFVFSCSKQRPNTTDKEQHAISEQKTATDQPRLTRIHLKNEKDDLTVGDFVHLSLSYSDSLKIDSVRSYKNSRHHQTMTQGVREIRLSTSELPVGNNTFKLEIFLHNHSKETHYKTVKLLSDIQPRKLTVKREKTYPHDPNAYTQGLFYYNGYLYEGTGKRGRSSLRKTELSSGELISSHTLPDRYFGEGIAMINEKIIQLTWTSRTGFVYDLNSFKLVNKVKYPTQGWGLTSDGKRLIMSDGTSTIYFLDPAYFNEIRRIKVYDDQGPVKNLNELEYIDGKVYANVWQESNIITFNPDNGKVLEKIDCSNIVPDAYKNHKDNVLNGIAYDREKQRIFLTGKRWSKLFQVKILEPQ
jgi:glutaminyl-peptide cyclotransferase